MGCSGGLVGEESSGQENGFKVHEVVEVVRQDNRGNRAPVKKVAAWRTRQSAPTPERYRQIQEALAAKGYLRPEEATGVWNPNSADALKKFQAEQKIDSTGKINSLSLIALGLGPEAGNRDW